MKNKTVTTNPWAHGSVGSSPPRAIKNCTYFSENFPLKAHGGIPTAQAPAVHRLSTPIRGAGCWAVRQSGKQSSNQTGVLYKKMLAYPNSVEMHGVESKKIHRIDLRFGGGLITDDQTKGKNVTAVFTVQVGVSQSTCKI